jgi:hypothetical protein
MAAVAAEEHVAAAGEPVAVDGGAPVEVANAASAATSLLTLLLRLTGIARVWNARSVDLRVNMPSCETNRAEHGERENDELDGDHGVRVIGE